MDFEALTTLGWREALIVAIALLAIYVAVVVLRMRRLKRGPAPAGVANPFSPAGAAAYAVAGQGEAVSAAAEVPNEPVEPVFAWNEPPEPFVGREQSAALERDIAQLRREVATLRAELRVVDEDTRNLREELRRELSQARAVQNASPLYSDAMQMAVEGHDAATISGHCGIARAEAELVVALARNRDTMG